MEQLLQLLNSYSQLSDGCLHFLHQNLKERIIRRGEYLLREGEVSEHIYFISYGLLRCYRQKAGRGVSRWFMIEGDVVFSIQSFYQSIPTNEYIQALKKTHVYYISRQQLDLVYDYFPEFNRVGRLLTEKYYQLWDKQLSGILMQSAAERYEWLRKEHPGILLRVPSKYIASYLDISDITLSKIKRESALSHHKTFLV